MLKNSIAILLVSLIAGAAYAQDSKQSPGLLERGIARIEHGLARHQAKLSGRPESESSEGCGDMMAGGMMENGGKNGSMMGSGEMMGGGMMGGSSPNAQWRRPDAR